MKSIIGVGIGTAGVLLTEHLLLYNKLERTDAYAVGTATILGGMTGYALLRPHAHAQEMIAAAWACALMSGATLKFAYWARGALERRDRLASQAGLIAGLGLSEGLSELKGGSNGTHIPEYGNRTSGDARAGGRQRTS